MRMRVLKCGSAQGLLIFRSRKARPTGNWIALPNLCFCQNDSDAFDALGDREFLLLFCVAAVGVVGGDLLFGVVDCRAALWLAEVQGVKFFSNQNAVKFV
jgi:hypothetical protein